LYCVETYRNRPMRHPYPSHGRLRSGSNID
jgi:hypothetical protein